MKRIAVVARSPLWAGGVAAALAEDLRWQVELVAASAAGADAQAPADAVVLRDVDAAALPPGLPAVVLGDATTEAAALRDTPRPLALLAADASPAVLRAAVAAVLEGLSVRDAARPFAATQPEGDHEPLTARELEVFELLGKGLSNRDIGGVLGISAHTAKFHVGQILAKVGAATRAEAVRSGLRLGLIGL